MGVVTMKRAAIISASALAFFFCGCAPDLSGEQPPQSASESSASHIPGQDSETDTNHEKAAKDAKNDKEPADPDSIKDNKGETGEAGAGHTKDATEGSEEGSVKDATGAESTADEKDSQASETNTGQASHTPDGKGSDPAPPEAPTAEKPQSAEEKPCTDKILLPMAAIILALAALSAWLVYDRRKRKAMERNDKSTESLSDTLDPAPSSPPVEVPPRFAVGNLHNIGQRDEQQDSFCLSNIGDENALIQKGALAVVADGMGGMEGGAVISQTVTDVFREKYSRAGTIENPRTFLLEAAQDAERAVEAYISRSGIEGGSTLVAILAKSSVLHFISVGDSHIYLWRNGQITQINREHNYGELLKEKAARGEVAPDEPYINPRRHALTAYIGKGSLNIVDQGERFLTSGDKIFLCSDGVYNALGDNVLAAALAGDAATAAQEIEKQVLAQNLPKQDNFTGIVLEYSEQKGR